MSSGVSAAAQQQAFLSTHNALRIAADEGDKVWIYLLELGLARRQAVLHVYPFYDIEMIKRLAIKRLELPSSTNVNEIRIFYRGSELPNHRSVIAFIPSDRDNSKIRFHWALKESSVACGIRELGIRPPPRVRALLDEIDLAMQRGLAPKLTLDGTGGTYMLSDTSRQTVAMFKPRDEEAFAPNNPRGYEGKMGQRGFRAGVTSGEGAGREVIAFLLDAKYGGKAGVPQTTKVEACHPNFSYKQSPDGKMYWKEGSLQEFVNTKETGGDFDARVFSVSDAHNIAIFDLRVLNLDRNDGNLLVGPRLLTCDNLTIDGKVSKYRLIPIDHGLILPDSMDPGDIDLVWFDWPQCKMPFSEEEIYHIFTLNPDRDALRLARKLDIREECLRTMRVATRVLQIGTRMRLNLHQIASLMVRFDDYIPSVMERGVKIALSQAHMVVNAASLVQQSRLRNCLQIDLHLAEQRQGSDEPAEQLGGFGGLTSKAVRFVGAGAAIPSTGDVVRPNGATTEESTAKRAVHLSAGASRSMSLLQSLLTSPEICPLQLPPGLQTIQSDKFSAFAPQTRREPASVDVPADCYSASSSESDSSDDLPSVSRITGVPLKGDRRNEDTRAHEGGREQDKMAPSSQVEGSTATLERTDAANDGIGTRRKYSMFTPDEDAIPAASGRRRPTALTRRGTRRTRLAPVNISSAWSVYDQDKRLVQLDWDDPLLEKTFFHCFELLIWHYILDTHPNWQSYPFNGTVILQDLERSAGHRRSAVRRKKVR